MKNPEKVLLAAAAGTVILGGAAAYVAKTPESYLAVKNMAREVRPLAGSNIWGDTEEFLSKNSEFIHQMSVDYGIREKGLEGAIRREIGPGGEQSFFGLGKYDEQELKAGINFVRSFLRLKGDFAAETGVYLGHSQGLLNEKAGLIVPRLIDRIKNEDLKQRLVDLVNPETGDIDEFGLARLVNGNHLYAIEIAAAHISLMAPAIEAYCKDHPGENPALWESLAMGWFAGANNGPWLQTLVGDGYLPDDWGYEDKSGSVSN